MKTSNSVMEYIITSGLDNLKKTQTRQVEACWFNIVYHTIYQILKAKKPSLLSSCPAWDLLDLANTDKCLIHLERQLLFFPNLESIPPTPHPTPATILLTSPGGGGGGINIQ